MEELSLAQARRLALAAQGFADPPHRSVTRRTVARTIARTGVFQVDSVNVLARAHELPLFSRAGPYDPAVLRQAAAGAERRLLVEYWAHVQALMPVTLWPVMTHRMAAHRQRQDSGAAMVALRRELLAELADTGPATARELAADPTAARIREHWGWNWSAEREALFALTLSGEVAIAGRNAQFEVIYDLPERVLPTAVLAAPLPERAEADRELVRRALGSHGIGTVNCLADYYRMPVAVTRRALLELTEAGEAVPVRVAGWPRPLWRAAGARLPRRLSTRTLLAPFDPVVWQRRRTEELFGFRYRIEIYTPAHRRVHGYYVLPFLLDDRLVGRVDLKADRQAGELLVRSAWSEPDAPARTATELALTLIRLQQWLDLPRVQVAPVGDLAGDLAAGLGSAER